MRAEGIDDIILALRGLIEAEQFAATGDLMPPSASAAFSALAEAQLAKLDALEALLAAPAE